MATFTETFNKADAATLGPDLTWTEVADNNWAVASNRAVISGGAGTGDGHARAEHDVDSADHYVEATLAVHTLPAGGGFRIVLGGIHARFDNDSRSSLCFQAETPATGAQFGLRRWVNGVESAQLAAHAQDPQAGDRMRIECEGTTIRCYVNDVLLITHTEATITTGTRGGMRGVLVGNAGTGALAIDDFEIGDLSAPPEPMPIPTPINVLLVSGQPG